MELEQKLQEFQYREQQLQLAKSSLQRHLEQVTEEKEEREKEAVSWFNALEVESHSFNLDIAYCDHPEYFIGDQPAWSINLQYVSCIYDFLSMCIFNKASPVISPGSKQYNAVISLANQTKQSLWLYAEHHCEEVAYSCRE